VSDRRRLIVGLALFAATLLCLMTASRQQGNVRDEGTYYHAGETYADWYVGAAKNLLGGRPGASFSRAAIERYFVENNEHPALMKTAFGLSERLLHRQLHLLSEEQALRFPAHLLGALLALCLFSWGARLWSVRAGVVAGVLGVAAPRLFFDAQLACFDVPIAAMWVFVVYAYWRSLDGQAASDAFSGQAPAARLRQERAWAVWAGVLFGLALATKHNAFFLPFILGAEWLWRCARARRLVAWPRAFTWMATVGPIVYFGCWPWLWFDTINHFRGYVGFHVNHVYYNMEFLGRNYSKPPFPLSFPYVMELLTVPLSTLALAAVGVVLLRRRAALRGVPLFLLVSNALFPMAILTLTRAPIFGATKHFHATIPFLALLAASGWQLLSEALPQRRREPLSIAFALAMLLPAVLETARSHPYGLSHYTLLAGGPRGGATLGMNRQFWGYATRGLFPWLTAHAPDRARIYWHDTGQQQLDMAKREGLLRRDLGNTGLEEPGVSSSDLALIIHEKHFNKYEYWIWDAYGTTQPTTVLTYEGVPVVTLYTRPGTKLK
jgi:hypothetical protein